MEKRILVVDDERLIVKGLKFSLEQEGYIVDCAYDGAEALTLAKTKEYDIVLLDLMLPVLSGNDVCQAIREFSDMPIIMLTAKADDIDKIMGLEYGADDYITKPFNILEVKARIKAIIRRSTKVSRDEKPKSVRYGDFMLDTVSRTVVIAGENINLTAKEFDILELMVFEPERVFSREDLVKIIWDTDFPGDVRTVDVHVRRLREKIEKNSGEPKYVHTKWGVGYFFSCED